MQRWAGEVVIFILVAITVCGIVFLEKMLYDPDINAGREMILYKYDYYEPMVLTCQERRELVRKLEYSLRLPVNPQQFYPEYVVRYYDRRGQSRRIFLYRAARIGWDETGRSFCLNYHFCRLLDNPIINLENRISERYGELIPWEKARHIFAHLNVALVTDVDTGKSFWAQRRAGSNHADVQPLTAQDSRIMKSIYNGKWSWDRRAIIVSSRNRRIAASMSGMPHGAGAIQNNEFDGHFCIHFYGSKTHSTNRADIRHQQMVLKAAGREWKGTDRRKD